MIFTTSLDGNATEVIAEGTPGRMDRELWNYAASHGVAYEFDAEDETGAVGTFYRDGDPVGYWAILNEPVPTAADYAAAAVA